MMDIPAVLSHLRPGEIWELNGDSMDGLVWLSPTEPPTFAEVQSAWPSVQLALEAERSRQAEAREVALAKLAALGLTTDDLAAIGL